MKMSPEMIDRSLKSIYKFYCRQHVKRDIGFDDHLNILKLDRGEYISFCKDFNINLSKNKIVEVFIRTCKSMASMDFDHFKDSLPDLIQTYF